MNPISALDGRKIFFSSIHFTRKLKKKEAIHIGVVLSSALYLVFCTAECRSPPPHLQSVPRCTTRRPRRLLHILRRRGRGRCTLSLIKSAAAAVLRRTHTSLQLLLVQASSDSTSVLVSWHEGSRGYSRTRPEVQCLVGSLRERGSESGLDSLLPQLLHGHGQRVDSGKVGVQTSWQIEDDILY